MIFYFLHIDYHRKHICYVSVRIIKNSDILVNISVHTFALHLSVLPGGRVKLVQITF